MGKAGRKSKAEEMGLKALLDKYVSPAARGKVVKRLVHLTNDEDGRIAVDASKLLLAYLYGTPKQSVELSGNQHRPLVIQYVDDWRHGADTSAETASGADTDTGESEAV